MDTQSRIKILILLSTKKGSIKIDMKKKKICKTFYDIGKIKQLSFKDKEDVILFKRFLKQEDIIRPVNIKHKTRHQKYLLLNPKYSSNPSDFQKRIFTKEKIDEMEKIKRLKWGIKVKEKYGSKCCICGSTKKLHAHHLNGWAKFPSSRFNLSNGVVMCKKCHIEIFHKKYGKNTTKEQFLEFKGGYPIDRSNKSKKSRTKK